MLYIEAILSNHIHELYHLHPIDYIQHMPRIIHTACVLLG